MNRRVRVRVRWLRGVPCRTVRFAVLSEVAGTFAFVDLAGFAALTEAHGDLDAAALVDRFEAITREALGEGDRFVKSIGDAVFFLSPTPPQALRAVTAILERCAAEAGFPRPRTGLHAGVAVARGEDLIGADVNLAARIAAQAHGSQVLASAAVAAAARAEGIRVVELGAFELRNITEPVSLYELDLCPASAGSAIDPVCRMSVSRADAAGRLRHRDVDYWFCSLGCVERFAAQPDAYTPPP